MTSEIDSLPLCCIFVWPETPVLMISPAAFVHLLQTKPVQVNWLLPTQAVCCDEAQRENNQGCLLLGVISENMCRDKLNNVMGEKEKKRKTQNLLRLSVSSGHASLRIIKLNSTDSALLLLFNF